MMNAKRLISSMVFGIIFSGIALYFTFKNIPLIAVYEYFKCINYWWAIPAVAVGIFSFVLRVIRWQIILLPVKRCSFRAAFHPLMIGFMLNCIMPGRVGEIARPVIFCKKEKVPFSRVLATVGAERIFDFIAMLLLFMVFIKTAHIDPDLSIPFGGYMLNQAMLASIFSKTCWIALALIGMIFIISFSKTRLMLSRAINLSPDLLFMLTKKHKDRIRQSLCKKAVDILDHLAIGFEVLKSPSRIVYSMSLSIILWLLLGGSYYILSFGSPGIDLSFIQISTSMIIICFFIILPSVPGYWGLWEAGGTFGLMIFGVSEADAAGYTLVNHFIQIFPVIIIGFISSTVMGINIIKAGSIDSDVAAELDQP